MKKTFFKSILCASLFVGALTSCNEVEDLYNPELVREQANKALGLDVAPNQDWNMTSVVTANITLNEDALSDYSFRIYTANPHDKNSGAVILADYPVKTDAQGKASASFKFEMPSYLEYVYVARVDNHGRRLVGIANISDNTISKSFGVSSSSSTRNGDSNPLYTMEAPYTESEIINLIASANILPPNVYSELSGVNVIKGEFDGSNLNYYRNASDVKQNILIVDNGAILTITSQKQYANIDIVVAKGGTLNICNEFKFNPRARLIVMQGGVVNHTKEGDNGRSFNFEHDYTNTCCIYNAGTINMVGTTYISSGGVFYNADTGVVNADIITTSTIVDVISNWGTINANEITSNNGNGEQGTLHNGCLIRCKKIRIANLNLAAGTALEDIEYLYAQNINLRENTLVKVNGTFEAKSNLGFNYCGSMGTDDYALFSAENILLSCSSISVNNKEYIFIERNTISTPKNDEQTQKDQENLLLNAAGSLALVGKAPAYLYPDDQDLTECIGKGNIPDDSEEETSKGNVFTYAFEDINKEFGDYDMNDVVLKCNGPKDGKITIKLMAVGAVKDLHVYFINKQSGEKKVLFEGKEVHEALGVGPGIITNTTPSFTVDNIAEEEIQVNNDFLFTAHGDFYIVDKQGNESHIPNFDTSFKEGNAPYGICVPCDWRYPREYVSIIKAYPPFVYWAGDVNEQDWYTADKAVLNNVY